MRTSRREWMKKNIGLAAIAPTVMAPQRARAYSVDEIEKRLKSGRGIHQDFHFGPGTVTVYTRAAPNTTSFRAEPCTLPPAAGPKARPSAHRR